MYDVKISLSTTNTIQYSQDIKLCIYDNGMVCINHKGSLMNQNQILCLLVHRR